MMMVDQVQQQVLRVQRVTGNRQRDQNTLCSNLEIAEGGDVVIYEDVDE
jgi:hypothetical protein